ncbi:carbohydrate ABC transporter permease [Clostridium swellfunianum]|uniref:carbohydrate ABC transporter permease n=1 Tax=Clostridium swellfunianum TaxID=1367462 RepID=UPI00202F89A0|nr:carbohydrate ABC transporter permease [Clostridium swellfunianum]MCM0646902.1 carbohydrate ABC transporter permease [Clostridium swellfunianum]
MSKKILDKFLIYLVLISGALLILLPFIWIFLTSVKAPDEIFTKEIVILPKKFRWDNYLEVLKLKNFARYLFNSVIVTVSITLGELITTILAAFAFSNLEFKGRDIIFTILMATMMVPGEVILIPNFVLLSHLKWINTYKALIIPWCTSVFAIFFLRQYFLGIPKQLYYAAKVDNCGDFKYITRIMMPIAKPAIITIALLKIINSWNSFMWPLIVTNNEEMRTLPIVLSKFSSEAGMDYHILMAASAVIILPMLIIFILLSKYIINGVGSSGIKG